MMQWHKYRTNDPGIAWLRTVAWFVSVIGMALIAIELLKVI